MSLRSMEMVLTSMFYELARDYMKVGALNTLMATLQKESTLGLRIKYSDKELQRWARKKAQVLLKLGEY